MLTMKGVETSVRGAGGPEGGFQLLIFSPDQGYTVSADAAAGVCTAFRGACVYATTPPEARVRADVPLLAGRARCFVCVET